MKTIDTKFFLLTSFLLIIGVSNSVFAQTGSLQGTVFDQQSQETIIGATIQIKDAGTGVASDFDGRYIIRNIPEGFYDIVVSFVGYSTLTVTEVEIISGERTTLDFVLSMGEAELGEITVTAYRDESTISSVVLDVRYATQVTSGVSRQQISLSQDGNAAQVMQRIPGVTIAENRFVFIRGLSERYNNVMINNSAAPSTEIDKRTFSFDMISSGSLDRMMIYKSGSPDLPGDFAGGVIQLFTIDNVDANFLKLSMGTGFRTGTTGSSFMQSNGSGTDFIGFDNGYRKLPKNFPSSNELQNSARNSDLRISSAHSLPNNFNPIESTALPDYSLGIQIGRNSTVRGRQLSTVTTIDYSTGFQYSQRDFLRYFEWVDQSQPILKRFQYSDDFYSKENKISLMSNWKLRFSENNYISFKNLFNQIGDNETIIRNGTDFIQRPDDELRNYLLGYRSRSIYSGQLEGYHQFGEVSSILWVAGGSLLHENEPDLRRFRTFRPLSQPNTNFSMQMPPSSNLFDTGRYFGEMTEFSINQKADYTANIGGTISRIKAGYLVDYRDRTFSSRYISYLYPGFFDPNVREDLIRLPLEEIFSEEYVRVPNGFVIEEGTRPIDSYTATSLTAAGYLSTEIHFGNHSMDGGLRVENNVQNLKSRDDFEEIVVKNPVLSVLPFLNASFSLHEKLQFRAGYGRTINRPEFRELAPFVFYDYKIDAGRVGNPGLVPATIDNADLRFEFYPRVGETISIGGFIKYFDKPIETKTTVVTENPQFGYINAESAVSYGVELEIRKSFQGVTSSVFIDRFSANLNGSLIFTEVDLGEIAVAQEKVRPLQGQSPYILNAALYYDHPRNLSGSVVYNVIGPRIFSVGDVLFPTIYEMPRHSMDVSLTKYMTTSASVQLGIQNLLNSSYSFYQDSDRNGKINTGRDHPIISYKSGQVIQLTFSYNF
ncbi:MAG: carboxypeptidase-like regulatory domain-containing protein [Balneolaceae bacterium]|nr:carboxypeptidase-like regulatory domain-containing protein [Balneolaceae bacterium]